MSLHYLAPIRNIRILPNGFYAEQLTLFKVVTIPRTNSDDIVLVATLRVMGSVRVDIAMGVVCPVYKPLFGLRSRLTGRKKDLIEVKMIGRYISRSVCGECARVRTCVLEFVRSDSW